MIASQLAGRNIMQLVKQFAGFGYGGEFAAALAYINQPGVFVALAQLSRDGQQRRNMAARPAAA